LAEQTCKDENNDIEFMFFELLKKCDLKIGKNETNRILQQPDTIGRTVAFISTAFFREEFISDKIFTKLKDRNIKMNYITFDFAIPFVDYETAIRFDLNPFVRYRLTGWRN
jgi:hypothetical protein